MNAQKARTYRTKEFCEKFPAPEIKAFFKHPERKTSETPLRQDFYEFWGISRESIQMSSGYAYEIPIEAADLFAGLISTYALACGADRRGVRTHAPIEKYSLDKYQAYITQLDKMMKEELEPFQTCLIKNYNSYYRTKEFNIFLPVLLERIAMLLAVSVSYGTDDGDGCFDYLIDQLDVLIEGVIRSRLSVNKNARKDSRLCSFEDGIAAAFRVLTTQENSEPEPGAVLFKDLEETILATRVGEQKRVEAFFEEKADAKESITQEDIRKFRAELFDKLNRVSEPYRQKQENLEERYQRNAQDCLDLKNAFWDASVFLTKNEQRLMEEYRDGLREAISDIIDSQLTLEIYKQTLKQKTIEAVEADQQMVLGDAVNKLVSFLNYEESLKMKLEEMSVEYDERIPTEEEFMRAAKELTEENNFVYTSGTFVEEKQRDIRRETCEFYKKIKESTAYQDLLADLKNAIGGWLPEKLVNTYRGTSRKR